MSKAETTRNRGRSQGAARGARLADRPAGWIAALEELDTLRGAARNAAGGRALLEQLDAKEGGSR